MSGARSPAFTPEQLAGVYVARWYARDMANAFLGYLRQSTALGRIARPVDSGKPVRFSARWMK